MAREHNVNAAKKLKNTSTAPWYAWNEKARHARAIRFLETYCIPHQGYRSGEPLTLAPFQKEWLEEVLAPGISVAVMSVAAGNGKSTLLGGLGVWALFDEDDTGAPSIPVIAMTIKMATETVYGAALAMVENHPELNDRAKVFAGIATPRIETPHNRGKLFPLSHDPKGLQGYNPSLAIVDEIGFQSQESWSALRARSAKRAHSLIVGIGTPGFDQDNPLWQIRSRAITGEAMQGFSYIEYTADEGCDIRDLAQLHKANPAIAAGFKNLEATLQMADDEPEGIFRTYQLGQWVAGQECWLGSDARAEWEALADQYNFLPGADTWLGVDISRFHDTTAVVTCQKRPRHDPATGEKLEDGYHVKAKIWYPSPENPLDQNEIQQHIREQCAIYGVQQVSYDPALFGKAADELIDEGYPMLNTPQTVERFTPIVGATYEQIKLRRVTHDGDPGFTAQVLNGMTRFNERGFTISKSKSTRGKIDAAVAMCLAIGEATSHEPEPPSYMVSYF